MGEHHDSGPHMLGIEVPRDAAGAIARQLNDDDVIASVRGNSLRVAPHLSEPVLRAAPGQERNHSLSPALADASAHIAAVS